MSVEKRNGRYTIRMSWQGKVYRLNPDARTKSEAILIEAEIKSAMNAGRFENLSDKARVACEKLFSNQSWEKPQAIKPVFVPEVSSQPTLWTGIELYVQDSSFLRLAASKDQARCLANLTKFFGKHAPIDSIWVPEIKQYREHRLRQGAQPATCNREVSALSRVFVILGEHRLVQANPCRMLKRLSEKSGLREVYICYEDVRKIMDLCPDWYADIVWTLFLTGCRRSEIVNLKWSQVNLPHRMIRFHAVATKEASNKRVPVHRELVPLFEKLNRVRSISHDYVFTTSGRPVCLQSCQRPWDRALDKLDWPKPRPRLHDLRHTWLTNARRSGVDHEIRQMILGHATKMKTVDLRYGFLANSELIEAIDKFTYEHGQKTEIFCARQDKKNKPDSSKLDHFLTIFARGRR